MRCLKLSELVNSYGSNWQSYITVKSGPHSTQNACENNCGVCCIPSCSITNVQNVIYSWTMCYGGDNSYCPPQIPTCSNGELYPSFSKEQQIWKVPLGSNNGVFSQPENIVWKPGYPAAALSFYADVFWVKSSAGIGDGDPVSAMNSVCVNGTIPAVFTWTSNGFNFTPGNMIFGIYYTTVKFALLGCTSNGNLVDITDIALDRLAMTKDLTYNPLGTQWNWHYGLDQYITTINTLDFEYTTAYLYNFNVPPAWANQSITVESYDLKNYLDGGGVIYTSSQDCQNANAGDCYQIPTDTAQDVIYYNLPGVQPQLGTVERLPLPHEGRYNMTYSCNDTISQSGCLYGGVISPSGAAVGIWHSGEICSSFNCNA